MSHEVLAGIAVAIFAYFLVGISVHLDSPYLDKSPKWTMPAVWMAYALAASFAIGFSCTAIYGFYRIALATINAILSI